jgi:hypothetical protein
MQLPYIELHAPLVRYRSEQFDKFRKHTGIVEIEGLQQAEDGTFGGVRITFINEAVMQRYADAGIAAVENNKALN